MKKQKETKKRWPLYAILGVFVVPMLVAVMLYGWHDRLHLRTVHQGILLSPPGQLENISHHWLVVQVPGSVCDVKCADLTYQLHQLWKVLGKDRSRVEIRRQFLSGRSAGVYLADPLGNLFMYYPPGAYPMAILKDLKHVLRISQIG